MKASVQYNDYTGSAAADRSDMKSLRDFISIRGVDTDTYLPIGAEFYHGENGYFNMSVICIDQNRSKESKPYIVSIDFEKEITVEEFFDLFKRFKVVITSKLGNFDTYEIKEDITIDDR